PQAGGRKGQPGGKPDSSQVDAGHTAGPESQCGGRPGKQSRCTGYEKIADRPWGVETVIRSSFRVYSGTHFRPSAPKGFTDCPIYGAGLLRAIGRRAWKESTSREALWLSSVAGDA